MQEPKTNEEEEIKGYEEVVDFSQPAYTFIPKGVHSYRQEGYYLVCKSCELTHATFIGKDKIMVGEKDGEPILKKRKEVGMA